MPVFNVSFLRPGAKRGGGSGYGVLVDQLTMLENELASDGKLAPGDYDKLLERAQNLAVHPGLTADQRSNIAVKISGYKKAKATGALDVADDISLLNREVQDDHRTNTMLNGGDVTRFLDARVASLRLKADRIAQSIDQRQVSGNDVTAHQNEYAATLDDLNDALDALDKVQAYSAAPNQQPVGDFVAYVQTNSRGEITGLEVGRPGAKTGYAETNGLMGGLQVYGKVNKKQSGKSVFRLGNVEYSGSDLQFQDPSNPGSFRNAPLVAGGKGANQFAVIENYQDIQPGQAKPQGVLRPGDYARGKDGAIYFSNPAGGYRKYKNVLPDQLGINPQDILDLPSTIESSVNAQSNETVDGNESAFAPQSLPLGEYDRMRSSAPAPAASTPAPEQSASGTPRTPAPVSRAPQSTPGLAARTIQGAKGYLSRIFG